jgi:hypothetical protein
VGGRRTLRTVEGVACDAWPSLIDSMGVLVLLAAWAVLDLATLRRRGRLLFRRELVMFTATAGIAALALVLWSVLGDQGAWWIVGAVVLAAIQLAAAARGDVRRALDGPPVAATDGTVLPDRPIIGTCRDPVPA